MPTLSIDYYGSLNKNATFWQELLKYVKLEGIKVYVMSGNWPKYISEKLTHEGYVEEIHYDSVASVLSHLSSKGLDTWLDEEHDSWYSEESAWWDAKASLCKELGCQIHFDSDIRFAKAFVGQPMRFVHTGNQKGMAQIRAWHKRLKLANTYYDDDDIYGYGGLHGMMSGFVPM